MRKHSNWTWEKGSDGVFRRVAVCTVCGKPYSNGNVSASRYCPDCAKEMNRAKTRERVRRHREKVKGAQP